jgi:hypothetical protein
MFGDWIDWDMNSRPKKSAGTAKGRKTEKEEDAELLREGEGNT